MNCDNYIEKFHNIYHNSSINVCGIIFKIIIKLYMNINQINIFLCKIWWRKPDSFFSSEDSFLIHCWALIFHKLILITKSKSIWILNLPLKQDIRLYTLKKMFIWNNKHNSDWIHISPYHFYFKTYKNKRKRTILISSTYIFKTDIF